MEMLLNVLANVVANVAAMGAGFRSWGMLYEPEVPEELL